MEDEASIVMELSVNRLLLNCQEAWYCSFLKTILKYIVPEIVPVEEKNHLLYIHDSANVAYIITTLMRNIKRDKKE